MPNSSVLPTPEPLVIARPEPDVELLLATDFDGTISPIVADPAAARIDPLAHELLLRAGSDPRIRVAFISGRDPDDLRRRTAGIRAFIAGSHGLECIDPSGRRLWSPRKHFPEPDPSLLAMLDLAGLRIEHKAYSMAVHFRTAPPRDHTAVIEQFIGWARAEKLEVMPGRKVVEVRLTGGGKRAGLRAIAGYVRARRIVYAGDDTTDFAALGYAATRGRAIFVESDERAAPNVEPLDRVRDIEALCALLEREVEAVDLEHDRDWRIA